jgi:hypothetical protein
VLCGHVKQKISTLQTKHTIIPSGKTQHPRTDIQNAQDQIESYPAITGRLVLPCFSEKQTSIDKSMYKKDE